ncbi:MAG: nucleoside hydrolase [Pirellulaceae bacterium]
MPRKVIIDCDPGIDDAISLMIALFDPRLEVVAITSTAGNVNAERASENLQALIECFDPPRRPRIGVGTAPSSAPPVDSGHLNGKDGLADTGLAVASLHQRHPAEKLIGDEVRAAPDEVTILALGPTTNISRALQRDPNFATQVGQIMISGGCVNSGGNVTAAAEFNCYFDAESARHVIGSKTTKTLIPLDVSKQVLFTIDLLDMLPKGDARGVSLLGELLHFAFRAHRWHLGIEGIYLQDAVALAALLEPELFEMTPMAGDVETAGEITRGATIFDRRHNREWTNNMEVATRVDSMAVKDCIVRGLVHAVQQIGGD